MLAMLGTMLNVPLTNTFAMAMTDVAQAASAGADVMPCHKVAVPEKPCPNCPHKGCLNMAMCVGSCFQPIMADASVAAMPVEHSEQSFVPVPADILSGIPGPPLLRPPIV
jgi:hypothetical protein